MESGVFLYLLSVFFNLYRNYVVSLCRKCPFYLIVFWKSDPFDLFSVVHQRFDNTCEYGDTCTFFISLIIKGGVLNTPFGGYACGWLKTIILRDVEH